MRPLLTALLLATTPVQATEWRLLEVDKLDFTYERLDPNNRHPYAPEYTDSWRERATLDWDIIILKYGYWNNALSTSTTDPSGQVKLVSWEWRAGIHLGKYIDVFHYHFSQHLQDEAPEQRFDRHQRSQFPVTNAVGITLHLYRRGKS